jgi:hypothetical protein
MGEGRQLRRPLLSDKLTVLLRIDGCRGLLQNFTFLSKVYLRSPGTFAGLSLSSERPTEAALLQFRRL